MAERVSFYLPRERDTFIIDVPELEVVTPQTELKPPFVPTPFKSKLFGIEKVTVLGIADSVIPAGARYAELSLSGCTAMQNTQSSFNE